MSERGEVVVGEGRESSEDGEPSDSLSPVYEAIDNLLKYATEHLLLDITDIDWARNQLFMLFGLDSYEGSPVLLRGLQDINDSTAIVTSVEPLTQLLEALYAARLADKSDEVALADTVMGLLTARPSTLAQAFACQEREVSSMSAMQWFYNYCVNNTYVKRAVLERNPRFDSHGLVITINLAKPEFKDPKKAAAGNSVASGYPKCTICHENEGFAGRNKRTLRTIPITLDGDSWFWQFSPYGYFDQHGICVNTEHTPMHVDSRTFDRLMDFVDRFPDYFLGCNAALPRIGGSVLAHDHYQGGGEWMPMHRAKAWKTLEVSGIQGAVVEILDWPGTAVRVVSQSRSDIASVSEKIRQAWVVYENRELGIIPEGKDGQQSALSPSVVRTERGYEMNLILRNNGVNEQYPLGIFHAHPEFFPVKQEAIGLIEAQGMFILPGRLVNQLAKVEQAIVENRPLDDDIAQFALEYDEVREQLQGESNPQAVHEAMQDELGSVCERILENTAVFKHKEDTEVFLRDVVFAQ